MAINKSRPMKFTPTGVTDAFDASQKFPGACQKLVNLTFSQSNPELVECRAGVVTLASFVAAGFTTPTFISVQVTIGPRIYGMIATGKNAGHDEPFIYDTSTNAFVPVGGTITAATTPTSPASSGDWVPPTIAVIGTMVIVTHPGFPGTAGKFFGYFDITNPASPTWNIANTVTTPLPAVPIAVANFNNRAWFVTKINTGYNAVFFTDVLTNPPTITNATQFLVIGDASDITALSGLPITTSSSGIIGKLIPFKATQIWQISGDLTTNDLAESYVSLTIGTQMPRSVAQAPYGLYFVGQGGAYYLDQLGSVRTVTYQLNNLEPDINVAFQNAVTPSRWAGAYASTVYRICGQTTINGIGQFVDYWFDEHKRRWNGPHTFIYDCAATLPDGHFVLSSSLNPGQLIHSEPNPSLASVYTDLGTSFNFLMDTSTFPKTNDELMKQVAESTIELAVGNGVDIYHIVAQNEQGGVMGAVDIYASRAPIWGFNYWGDGSVWGGGAQTWGGGGLWGHPPVGSGWIWGASTPIPRTYPVQWQEPLVFDKMQLQISGIASRTVAIGTFYARYQQTGYQAWVAGAQISVAGNRNGV